MGAASTEELAIINEFLDGGESWCDSEGRSYNNGLSLFAKNADAAKEQYREDIRYRQAADTDAIANQEYSVEMVLFTSTDKSPDDIRQDLQDAYMEYRMQSYANDLDAVGGDLNMVGMKAGGGAVAAGGGAGLALLDPTYTEIGFAFLGTGLGAIGDSLRDIVSMGREYGVEELKRALQYKYGSDDTEPIDEFMADWAVIDTYTDIEQADSIERNLDGITQFPGEDLDKDVLDDWSTLDAEEMPDGCTAYTVDLTMPIEEPVNR